MEEDSDASATTRVTSNNTNDNNHHIITHDDYDETEDYEATDPDNLEAKITDIASWTHDDLVHNTVQGVNTFMTYWHLHSYRWYCYNCNQQLVSTGADTWEWECPTCKYLEACQGDNEAHWDFGICVGCNNIGPADVTCVTCPLNQSNMNTYADQDHEDVPE
jgi:phage FluMu protein Com